MRVTAEEFEAAVDRMRESTPSISATTATKLALAAFMLHEPPAPPPPILRVVTQHMLEVEVWAEAAADVVRISFDDVYHDLDDASAEQIGGGLQAHARWLRGQR